MRDYDDGEFAPAEVDEQREIEYYQQQREEDALYYELGERVWYPLVVQEPQWIALLQAGYLP